MAARGKIFRTTDPRKDLGELINIVYYLRLYQREFWKMNGGAEIRNKKNKWEQLADRFLKEHEIDPEGYNPKEVNIPITKEQQNGKSKS